MTRIEEAFYLVGRVSNSLIGDGNAGLSYLLIVHQLNGDETFGMAELDGVRNQVVEDSLESVLVA